MGHAHNHYNTKGNIHLDRASRDTGGGWAAYHLTVLEQVSDCSVWSRPNWECSSVLERFVASSAAAVTTQLPSVDGDVATVAMVTSSPLMARCLCRHLRLFPRINGVWDVRLSEGTVVTIETEAGHLVSSADVALLVAKAEPAVQSLFGKDAAILVNIDTVTDNGVSTHPVIATSLWQTAEAVSSRASPWFEGSTVDKLLPRLFDAVSPPRLFVRVATTDTSVTATGWVAPSGDCDVCTDECCCRWIKDVKVAPHIPQRYGLSCKHTSNRVKMTKRIVWIAHRNSVLFCTTFCITIITTRQVVCAFVTVYFSYHHLWQIYKHRYTGSFVHTNLKLMGRFCADLFQLS